MCVFSEMFGLHPWDVDRLTGEQFEAYAAYVEARIKQQRG